MLGKQAPPQWTERTKGHGRLEERELRLVACPGEMQVYLEEYFHWPGVQWCGRIRRRRRRLHDATWTQEHTEVWIAGAAFPWKLEAKDAARLLREHWHIENRVFYVRDVTLQEDRFHGRKIGLGLSSIRNLALTLARYFFPHSYLPDAHRRIAARLDDGLAFLFTPLLEH